MSIATSTDTQPPALHEADSHDLIRVQGARENNLKDVVAGGDTAHEQALKEMKGRWKNPIKGMGWYKNTKKEFATLPED